MSKEYLEVTVGTLKLYVEFYYSPASSGLRETGTGLQLEPDEDESVEIVAIRVFPKGFNLLSELTENDVQEVYEALRREIANEQQRRTELLAESRIENQKERSY